MTGSLADQSFLTLAKVPCFGGVPESALSKILAGTRQRHIARGEVLIRQGDAADDLFIVLSGRFTVASPR